MSERPVSSEVSARDGVATYLAENGFDERNYDEPHAKVSLLGINFALPNPPSRRQAIRRHDLHHVATGYGTDLAGEAEVSAWEIRAGLGDLSLYVRLLVATALTLGFCLAPIRTVRAYRSAKNARSLFAQKPPHEDMYALSVGELRALMGIPREGIATIRGKHSTAPKTPRSA